MKKNRGALIGDWTHCKVVSHMGIELVSEFIQHTVVDTYTLYTHTDIYTHNRGALIGDLTYCTVVSHMGIKHVSEFILILS